jgi:hypothetical protein
MVLQRWTLFLSITGSRQLASIVAAKHFTRTAVNENHLFSGNTIALSIMGSLFQLSHIAVHTYHSFDLLPSSKCNGIATAATKHIKYRHVLLFIGYHGRSNMVGNCFWGDRVPRFFIELYSFVKPCKKPSPLGPEFISDLVFRVWIFYSIAINERSKL